MLVGGRLIFGPAQRIVHKAMPPPLLFKIRVERASHVKNNEYGPARF